MSGPKKNSMFDMLSSLGKSDDGHGLVVPLSDIVPDPNQPRKSFDQEGLESLAESIREAGIIEPLVVSPTGGLPPYMLVAGERRWRAAAIAGLEEVPIHLRVEEDTSPSRRSLVQLIENANRSDLTDLETARSIQALIQAETEASGKKRGVQARIAKLANRSPASISRLLGMLEPDVLPWSEEGLVVQAEAIAVLRSAPADVRDALLEEAAKRGEPLRKSEIREALAIHRATLEAPASPSEEPIAEAPAEPGSATNLDEGSNSGSRESGDPVERDSSAGNTAGAAGGEQQEHDHAEGEDSNLDSGEVGQRPENDDDDDDGEAGHEQSGPISGGAMHNPPASNKPRSAAASLKLSGERIETLLRYFVDKATDTVELRLPADLAVAVIENMGGEVPDRAELYSDRIRDLLLAKEET